MRGPVARRRSRLARLAMLIALLALGSLLLNTAKVSAAAKPNAIPLVPAGLPSAVAIPRIHVQAPLEHITGRSPHDSEAPYQWNDAAWFTRAARPGDVGHAIIFGHLDSTCCPAVFWNLGQLHQHDVIQVAYPGRRTLTFRVMWSHSFWNNKIPMKWIFSRGRQRGLVLWTCSGVFHTDGTGYDHKLILYARLVLPGGRLG